MAIKIHTLHGDPGKKQKKKRVGRGEGSGLGKTSGKGHKGSQARSGGAKHGSFEGGQMPLIRRIPKFGFTNLGFRELRAFITLRQLNRFEDGAVVDIPALNAAGLVPKNAKAIKLICKGMLERKLTVKVNGFSAGAKTAIEARGGKWEII